MEKLTLAFNAWFKTKTESEQKLLKLVSVIFSVFLVITVVSKISTGITETERKLKQQVKLNVWAKQQISIIQSASENTANTGASGGSITQIINSTARKYNVVIERIQPQKNDLVKVGIDEMGFNNLMSWLTELQTKHNINAQNIDISKADTTGMVKIRRLDLGRD